MIWMGQDFEPSHPVHPPNPVILSPKKLCRVATPEVTLTRPGMVPGKDEEKDREHEQDEKDGLDVMALRAGWAACGSVVHGG